MTATIIPANAKIIFPTKNFGRKLIAEIETIKSGKELRHDVCYCMMNENAACSNEGHILLNSYAPHSPPNQSWLHSTFEQRITEVTCL